MVTFPRLAALTAVLSLTATFVAHPAAAGQRAARKAVPTQATATPLAHDEDARRIWADDALFGQLSSASQARLVRAFGPRPGTTAQPLAGERPFATNLAETTAFTNVLVNNPGTESSNDTQSETSCLVAGTSVIAAYNDSASNATAGGHFTGYSVSTDGGATFTDKGVLPTSTDGDAGDPVLARDNTSGAIYMATLGFNTDDNLEIFKSTDGGQTFGQPVASSPASAGGDSMDKEWIAVDNYAGAGQGNLYCFWRDFAFRASAAGMKFSRSTDGGATFTPNVRGWLEIENNAGQGAWVTVGPDHAVYCVWLSGSTGAANIKIRKSTDQGVTFAAAKTITTIASGGTNGDLGLSGGFRTNTFPQAVVNPANPNVIYVVFDDKTATSDKSDIFMCTSTDGGSTWSAKTRVNDDATSTDQWQPSLAISPDGSKLFVGYYTREFDPNNTMIDTTCRVGTTSGGTVNFGASQRVTTQSFPVVVGVDPAIVGTYMGDYDNASADSQFFYYTWGDNRDRNTANTRFNQNVRFAKIPVGATPPPGADTVGLYLSSGATFFLKNSNAGGAADVSAAFGTAGATPIVGDWDGDGVDTVGQYIPATGFFFLKNSNAPGNADLAFQFGNGGSFVPIVGDWDGNGTTTVGLYDPASGTFYLKNSNTSGNADLTFQFGVGGLGFVPLAGDWDNNGTDTVGLYLPSSGTFFLKYSNSGGDADLTFVFGAGGQVPITGDFDGDGTDTIGVYDTASSTFFLRNTNTGGNADLTVNFGSPGQGFLPLIGDYDGL